MLAYINVQDICIPASKLTIVDAIIGLHTMLYSSITVFVDFLVEQ